MEQSSGKPDRTLVVILSIIVAVVILALVVVFTRGAPQPLDPATPEGVVQAYASAVIDGDHAAATELLSSSLRDNCESTEPYAVNDVRVTLVSTNVTGASAVVRVSIVNNYGNGPFGSSEYESAEQFRLVQEGSSWRIDSPPGQLTICYNTKGN